MDGLYDIFVKNAKGSRFPGDQLRESVFNVRGDSPHVIK
jgi:hypothetical protein